MSDQKAKFRPLDDPMLLEAMSGAIKGMTELIDENGELKNEQRSLMTFIGLCGDVALGLIGAYIRHTPQRWDDYIWPMIRGAVDNAKVAMLMDAKD